MIRWFLVVAAVGLLAVPGPAAAAKPHIAATAAIPHGLTPGGFGAHSTLAASSDGSVWVGTGGAKPYLLHVSAKGKVSKIRVPGAALDFEGLGIGPGAKLWWSATTGGGAHTGVTGTASGTSAHVAHRFADSTSWSAMAALGSTVYVADGFGDLEATTDNASFTAGQVSNVGPWDVAAFGGGLAVAGDTSLGLLSQTALSAGSPFTATLLATSSAAMLGSRDITVAGGKLWFLDEPGGNGQVGVGFAGPDGATTTRSLSGLVSITTGPGGAPWVLTGAKAEKLGPTGAVTASVKLPSGQRGIAISGSAKDLWVATINGSRTGGKIVKIAD